VIGAVIDAARLVSSRAQLKAGVVIRPLASISDLQAATRLFDEVWRPAPGETSDLQPALLRALAHSGNYVVGAFTSASGPADGSPEGTANGIMVAAAAAFMAAPAGRSMHSHITGVRPGLVGTGIGAAIKWHQRAWALERGLDTITWTFDPLIARNAYFNIVRLGARPGDYLTDFYGVMADGLNAGQPTDRVFTSWELTAPAVLRAAAGQPVGPVASGGPAADSDPVELILTVGPDGGPQSGPGPQSPAPGPRAVIGVPADIEGIRRCDPALALRWRLALREALAPMINGPQRWQVTGFSRSLGYQLDRPAHPHADPHTDLSADPSEGAP